ncbi:MAG: PEP-CTERM sorting domain-containing protein [Akkermansiaceae bacterium]
MNLPNDPDGSEDFVYLTNTSMFDPFIPQGTWNDHYDESTFFGEMPFSAIIEVQPIPEPSSALLVCLPAFAFLRRRR